MLVNVVVVMEIVRHVRRFVIRGFAARTTNALLLAIEVPVLPVQLW